MSNNIKNQNVEQMMNDFINKLVVEAGMDKDVDEEVLAQLKNDLKNRLEDRINAAILSQIPENKLEEFEKLIDTGNEETTQAFCSENIPNLNELIASEFMGFRNRYILNTEK